MSTVLFLLSHWKLSLIGLLIILLTGYFSYIRCDRVIEETIDIDTTTSSMIVEHDPITVIDNGAVVEDPVFPYDMIILDTVINGMPVSSEIDLQNLSAEFIFPMRQININKSKIIERTNWTAVGIGTGVGCMIGTGVTLWIIDKLTY